ncbi:MAG TPA: GGDEF domain-containing protein [Lysobacter sp.]|nr:GGDEF domain-containing protein [Lysobacter sp.]
MSALSIAFAALFGLLALTLIGLVDLARRERRRRERERLRRWIAGLTLQVLAWPAFALAHAFAALPLAAVGCGLLLCGYIEHARVLERMLGLRASPPLAIVAAPALPALLLALHALGAAPGTLMLALWSCALAIALWFAARLRDPLRRKASAADRATAAVLGGAGLVAALRLVEQVLAPQSGWDLAALSPAQALALGYFLVAPVLASVGFLLMHHERQRQRLEHAAACDPLTGIYNRRGFVRHAVRVLRRARYNRVPLALMLIDVDHFKQINDSYGHQAGDAVLAAVARAIDGMVRPADLFARLGGDEFVLLCPADAYQAHAIAERIGRVVRGQRLEWEGTPLRLTVSIGVAQARHAPDESIQTLLREADRHLYAAKRGGRDRSAGAASAGLHCL